MFQSEKKNYSRKIKKHNSLINVTNQKNLEKTLTKISHLVDGLHMQQAMEERHWFVNSGWSSTRKNDS